MGVPMLEKNRPGRHGAYAGSGRWCGLKGRPVRTSRAGRSREGKPRELRGGEQPHPNGGSGLVVAKHGREEGEATWQRPQWRVTGDINVHRLILSCIDLFMCCHVACR